MILDFNLIFVNAAVECFKIACEITDIRNYKIGIIKLDQFL